MAHLGITERVTSLDCRRHHHRPTKSSLTDFSVDAGRRRSKPSKPAISELCVDDGGILRMNARKAAVQVVREVREVLEKGFRSVQRVVRRAD